MTTCVAAKRILVCDDEDDILDMLAHLLNMTGYAVSTAHDHKEFMAKFHEAKPDLVLLDVRMPEHDGFWIAERLQDMERVPIIFITAHDRPVYRMCAPIVGAVDYLAKPIDPDILLARIDKALNAPRTTSSGRFLESFCE